MTDEFQNKALLTEVAGQALYAMKTRLAMDISNGILPLNSSASQIVDHMLNIMNKLKAVVLAVEAAIPPDKQEEFLKLSGLEQREKIDKILDEPAGPNNVVTFKVPGNKEIN